MELSPRRPGLSPRSLKLAALNALLAARQISLGWILVWEKPLGAGTLAMACYAALSWIVRGSLLIPTSTPYYNYLADAFLHGQLYLRFLPPRTRDLVLYHGHYFLYWGPLPAIILMPFIVLFGVGLSDVVLSIFLAGINVLMVALVLRQAGQRDVLRLTAAKRGLLVMCFALGTVQITMAPYGRVWNLDQFAGFFFVACAYYAALRCRGGRAFVVTGVALAAALATRNHMVLAGIWPVVYLLIRDRQVRLRGQVVRLVLLGIPSTVVLTGLGLYDWLRFRNPLQFGIPYHLMAPDLIANYRRYGFMSLHYVSTNVYHEYLAYPLPVRIDTLQGGSLFLLTPIFAFALLGLVAQWRSWSAWGLALTIVAVNIPILLLMGPINGQIGPRYTLDFTLPLLMLTAIGIRRIPTWLVGILVIVAVVQYVLFSMLLGSVLPA